MLEKIAKSVIVLIVLASCSIAGWAEDRARPGGWKNGIGPGYVSSFRDVVDFHEDVIGGEIEFFIPVGVTYNPYYQFNHGSRIGIDLGPAMFVYTEYIGPYYDEENWYYCFPIKLSYGFTFIPRATVSPYARVGASAPFAGGDFVDGWSPGLFGAVGVEFSRKRAVGFGLEFGYDKSSVELGVDSPWVEIETEYTVNLRVIIQ
jgi:hypothetical protein